MAPTQVLPHDFGVVGTLHTVGDAVKAYDDNNGNELVYGPLRQVIVAAGATERFGIRLLHTYEAVTAASAVEAAASKPANDAPAATASSEKTDNRHVRMGTAVSALNLASLSSDVIDNVVPIVWGFSSDGSVFPVEFALSTDAADDNLTTKDLELFSKIWDTVKGNQTLAGALGISLVKYQASGVECGTITLPFDFVETVSGTTRSETSWSFGAGEDEVNVLALAVGDTGAQSFCGGGCYYPPCPPPCYYPPPCCGYRRCW
ncbi:hypothetical protein BDQ12DRAFT_87585 [Crucibulum laeve]|uniref:Uncharacterized protein n=1 Tax=Crucibulum laeve TaxID=68775 RepID=A0A5C3M0S1_9AGAR|nr:hypothetical protein BDQ12DRAFT_87585 [Crucibulum laeve]